MKIDYSVEIRNFLENNYHPVLSVAHDNGFTEHLSLKEIHSLVCAFLPSNWVQESDIYDALQDLNFKVFPFLQETFTIPKDDDELSDVIKRKVYLYYLQPL